MVGASGRAGEVTDTIAAAYIVALPIATYLLGYTLGRTAWRFPRRPIIRNNAKPTGPPALATVSRPRQPRLLQLQRLR